MNTLHQNARLTVHSREQIVARIVAGQTAAEVAAAFAVSVRMERGKKTDGPGTAFRPLTCPDCATARACEPDRPARRS